MVECQLRLHPTAGRHYVHVFPSDQFLWEIRDCYLSAARRIPWMSVDNLPYWNVHRPEWDEPERIVIFWGCIPEYIPSHRKAAAVLRYTESVGIPEGLNSVQNSIVERFSYCPDRFDLLLGGTSTVANFWAGKYRETAFAPIGYEPAILGRPHWPTKTTDIAFRGNAIGRRNWILGKLRKSFPKLLWIHSFGLARKVELDRSKIDLYVGHSDEPSFPGMRLWQGIASSAALVTEPRDAFPAVAGRHYLEIPSADPDMFGYFVESIRDILKDEKTLERIAKTAHIELSAYTIDRCMEEFVVPATRGLHG
jgi:hypothetical protein